MADGQPTGTVTFLFTDIEGSTRLWDERPDDMRGALAIHDQILRRAIEDHGGFVFSTGGDGFAAAFHTPADALGAALEAQDRVAASRTDVELRIRMGLHTGVADERDGDYFGPTVNTAARLAGSVGGSQIALTGETRLLLPEVAAKAFGPLRFSGISRPVEVHLVVGDGLDSTQSPSTNGQHVESSLIGRQEEAEAIRSLLSDYPLVTLVGPGGVGKTSLALQAAATLGSRFPGGVFVSELAGANDHDDIAGLVARQVDADSLAALRLRSAGAPTLLVLDNCESALAQTRSIATDLVNGDSPIRVLATSRSPLYAGGERLVSIPPLAVPDESEDDRETTAAVELFLKRAAEAGATWPANEQNVRAAGRLTRRLNGLPLAIELAAARSRTLAPGDLVDLLDNQLDLLVQPRRAGTRHHSLRSVIAASYEPMTSELQQFFRRLSVIAAPFDLGLAHAVAGDPESTEIDTLDLLEQLVDASLLDVRPNSAGTADYRLLDSIRAFGRERLEEAGNADIVGDRFADAVTAIAGDIVAAALDSFTPEILGVIRDRLSHLVNAIHWCLDHDTSPARAYAMFLPFYGPTGARREIADLAKRIRDTWDEAAPFQAEAFAVMATSTFLSGDYQAGADLARIALDHPDGTDLAKLMSNRTLGYMAALNGDSEGAKRHLDDAIETARPFSAAFTRELQISRAAVMSDPAESAAAIELLADVRHQSAENDEWVMVVWSAVTAAFHHMLLGDAEAAAQIADEALATADSSGLPWSVSTAHRYVASVHAVRHGWDAAAPHFREALDATLAVGDIDGVAMALRAASGAARHSGRDDLATQLWATIPARPGLPIPRSIFHDLEEELLTEVGPPQPIDSDTLVRTARHLLGPPLDGSATAVPAAEVPSVVDPPSNDQVRTIRFGDYALDPAMRELQHNGERVHMEPQVYDVLLYLIEHRGQVVTKEELLDEVWGDRFVSESALTSRIAAARRATGDSGKRQEVIRTVHGKGFTFVADLA